LKKHLSLLVTSLLLAACVAGYFLTNESALPTRKRTTDTAVLVDDHLLQTAQQLASLADQNDDQSLAKETLRLTDNELDQAYASALREATAPGPPPTGKVKEATGRVAAIKARIKAVQEQIAKLTKPAETSDDAAEQLELAQAQKALDEDELTDAQEQLMLLGGDRRAKLERAMKARQRALTTTQLPKLNTEPVPASLFGQAAAWFTLDSRDSVVRAARQQADTRAAALHREHDAIEALVNKKSAPKPQQEQAAADEEDSDAMLARLQQLSDARKTQTETTRRIQEVEQLSDVYARWSALLEQRQRAVVHLLLRSAATILVILISGLAVMAALRKAFDRRKDPRNARQLRVISVVAVQILCGLMIVLVCFGMPSQTSTLIGITTAGLTVVLKDFIVAFFGWFALIGKNGIHVGDWVEIEGIGGEVVEIGLIKTVLLEMGNWTNSGHPTGRRVTFNNKYAIEQHYFNFSTTSQWLWDELVLTLPMGVNPYTRAQEIRQRVEDLTAADAEGAEQDWLRVTQQYGTRAFSAKPSMDLKPGSTGLDVVVRYITRAPIRAEMKSKLFAAMVDLLHGPDQNP